MLLCLGHWWENLRQFPQEWKEMLRNVETQIWEPTKGTAAVRSDPRSAAVRSSRSVPWERLKKRVKTHEVKRQGIDAYALNPPSRGRSPG
jgi:hypothetical protein